MTGEERSGAIRMLAFGVLTVPTPERVRVDLEQLYNDYERELEAERMVMDEINALGWKLAPKLLRNGFKKQGAFILLGEMRVTNGFTVRPRIGEGTLQECCRAAVHYLDTGKTEEVRLG